MVAQQKVAIKIPKEYTKREREAIALDIVEFIRERTKDGKDKDNKKFPKYSTEYKKSFNFKVAGKSSNVDLVLTGDMLDALDVLKTDQKGKVEIGYEKGDPINGKVEGNRLGTYGNSKPLPGKARDFLGIDQKALDAILEKYPLEDRKERIERAIAVIEAFKEAKSATVEQPED